MDEQKVDLVIKYALAVAAREDERWSRQLGAIHLLKYVYLADLAFAQRNDGRTFTGAEWRFYHYGPWSPAVHARIGLVVAALGATECRFASPKFEDDVLRWTLTDEHEAEAALAEADPKLPSCVTSALHRTVHKFGSDTGALLNFVYATPPMSRAAPNELLRFDQPRPPVDAQEAPAVPELTAKQKKKQRQSLMMLQQKAQALLAARRAEQEKSLIAPQPRYDEVFEQGSRWLDSLAGGEPEPLRGEVSFPDEIWKSEWREPDDE